MYFILTLMHIFFILFFVRKRRLLAWQIWFSLLVFFTLFLVTVNLLNSLHFPILFLWPVWPKPSPSLFQTYFQALTTTITASCQSKQLYKKHASFSSKSIKKITIWFQGTFNLPEMLWVEMLKFRIVVTLLGQRKSFYLICC